MDMPLHITQWDIGLRLLLGLLAGAVIGLNRDEHGRPAGMRTTILVCLAATVSDIQMNILLPTLGKTPESFSVMDIMRLPLGILSGIGFIGAGAILKKGDTVSGVTTAATLWFITVIGLCIGAGQIWLGVISTALCMVVLWLLRKIESGMLTDKRATLLVKLAPQSPLSEATLREQLREGGIRLDSWGAHYTRDGGFVGVSSHFRWRARRRSGPAWSFRSTAAERLGARAAHS